MKIGRLRREINSSPVFLNDFKREMRFRLCDSICILHKASTDINFFELASVSLKMIREIINRGRTDNVPLCFSCPWNGDFSNDPDAAYL